MSKSKSMSLFSVLLAIRDARSTRGAQREFLIALGLRCKPEQRFVCWPSYEQLAKDTQLKIVTLKKAARGLEEAGYISRTIRPHRSNKFFINMGKIVAEAEANREAEAEARAARKIVQGEESPFAAPVLNDTPETEDAPDTDDESADSYIEEMLGRTK
jgi:DNA-binding MarR family transcriptional regulator